MRGLKTGIYYLRRKPKHQAQQFTIEPERDQTKDGGNGNEGINININNNNENDICEMCSS
jgi:hypothetical protein